MNRLLIPVALQLALVGLVPAEAHGSRQPAACVVEQRPGYNSWPMIQAVGEKLICIYSRGTKHDIFEGVRDVWAKTSSDGGKTWSDPVPVANAPDYGEVPIGKGLDEKGAALFWVRSFGGPRPHHSLYRTMDGRNFECLSTPNLAPLPMQITDIFHVPGRGLVALWFAGNYNDKDRHKCWGEVVSADGGRTWNQRTIGKDLSKDAWPTEPSVVRLDDGRLIGIARSERYAADKALQWQLESQNDGRTWTCRETNIRDVMASTPSLLLDSRKGLLYNYYYERGKGVLKCRVVDPERIWGNPSRWPAPEVVADGGDSPWDAGNANATVAGGMHYVSYYSGNETNTSVLVAALSPEAKPVKVIFDTDMYTDFDDVGALACLHALQDAGECEILATLSCTRDCMSVAMCEIVNAYYGRPEIPVGCVRGMGLGNDREGMHEKRFGSIVRKYAKWVRHRNSSSAPDAADVYRQVLSSQPDKSVVICSVGFLTNLRKLVEMDRDLVARKVRLWVAMACSYPKGREYNSMMDAASSKIALERWPTPVVFSDFQYGVDCYAGKRIADSDVSNSPVADAFRANKCDFNGASGRSAWDETAVLVAVRGAESYFNIHRGTYRMVGDKGDDEWVPDEANGPHVRITEKLNKVEVGNLIDELICRGVR